MAILGFHLTSPKFRLRNCRFFCVSIQNFINLGKTFFLISRKKKKIVPCNITLTSNNLESVCTGLYIYPNTSFIHITRHRRSFYMFVGLRARKIRYYLVFLAWRLFLFNCFNNVYWNSCMLLTKRESRSLDSIPVPSKAKGGSALSCYTSHYRSMQEVQLDKHVKLVDSPGIVMDNSNSDSAVILRNCVKVRFHSVVQEWPTLIF